MGPTRRLNDEELEARRQRQVLEKDDTERQLEKILFGDQAGFLNALNDPAQDDDRALTRIRSANSDDDGSADEDLEDVADEDLFFLDGGAAGLPDDVMEDLQTEQEDGQQEDGGRKALWHDSDDERITVSLASHNRLRKLRDTEDDDVISGLEYIQRLRRQYERLHPTPDWVKYARKKRKLSNEDTDSDSDSDVDISIDSTVQSLSELLRTAGSLTRSEDDTITPTTTRTLKLRPETIDIERQKDIASTGPSSVDTIQFHPTYPLLLTAGPSSTVTLYHISPSSKTPNPILTSLHIKNTPLKTAAFALPPTTTTTDSTNPPPTKIYLSSRRRYFHTYTLQSQSLTRIIPSQTHNKPTATNTSLTKRSPKNRTLPTCEDLILSPTSTHLAIIANTGPNGGTVHVLSTTTHQTLHQIRIDSPNGIATVIFYRDGTGLSIVGRNGEVSEYSLSEQRVVARWIDDGAVGTTTAAMGGEIRHKKNASLSSTSEAIHLGTERYIAIGSTSGIVNIYDRTSILSHFNPPATSTSTTQTASYRPKPLKTFDHLTTPVSHLHFSPDKDGQLLIMASRWKKNALRLIHTPTCSVYRNWPTDRTPLGRISSVAVSPDGGYLAVGNEAGKVRLWSIRD